MNSYSKFYRSRAEPKPTNISYLLLEALQATISGTTEDSLTGEILEKARALVNLPVLTDKKMIALAEDLSSVYSEASTLQTNQANSQTSDRPTLGSDMAAWLRGLTPTHTCYLLSGFDPERAEHLYCEVDHRTVIEMFEVYVTEKAKMVQTSYEATMYGFGGSYKDDKRSSSSNVIDLTETNKEGLDLLGSLGF